MERKSHGYFFGYPQCCIDSFQTNLKKRIKFQDLPLTQRQAAAHGFVPCEVHAEQILKGTLKIQDLILPTRQCTKPFLKDNQIGKTPIFMSAIRHGTTNNVGKTTSHEFKSG
jgi:hypothetical protein